MTDHTEPEDVKPPTPRQRIGEAVQASAAGDEDIDGAVLVGWVTVAEFMDPSGEKWLSLVAGDARGETPPIWQIQGYLHNMLNDGMPIHDIDAPSDDDD